MSRAHNSLRLDGQRFGHLIVVRRDGTVEYGADKQGSGWVCQCDCGREIVVVGWRLKQGKPKSCGQCKFRWENAHGGPPLDQRFLCFSAQPEYGVWQGMWERCTNANDVSWLNYGGRGIVVCERWKDFDQFLSDMRSRPTGRHTIERNDNDGPYAPDNCRWATYAEQRRNMRNSVYVEFEGRRVLLLDLAAELGLNRNNIYGRLRKGWPLDVALTTPIKRHKLKVLGDGSEKASDDRGTGSHP